VTAALGAESYYTLEQAGQEDGGESARSESPAQARKLDRRTLEAWQESKSHFIVGNSGFSWPEKREQAKRILGTILGETHGSSANIIQTVECAYMPPHAIVSQCASDDSIPWTVSEQVTMTYLSSTSRLQKMTPRGATGSVLYFYQDLDADGHVVKQYMIDFWTYKEKLRTVESCRSDALAKAGVGSIGGESAGVRQLHEVSEERVIFALGDHRIRCRCLEDERRLEVEICTSIPAEQVLPSWLRSAR